MIQIVLPNFVYKVLSEEFKNLDFKILKSDGVISVDGNEPSHIPVTVVIPEIVRDFSDTDSIFAKTGTVNPALVKCYNISYSCKPTKFKLEVDTVDIPKIVGYID
jgi:hypothetical protein